MRRITLTSLAVVVLLAGCSAPDAPATFSNISELRDAFIAAGGACDDWDEGDEPGPWAQYGNCNGGDATLSTYASADDLKAVLDDAKTGSTYSKEYVLAGENWLILSDDADEVQDKLGGTLVTVGKD